MILQISPQQGAILDFVVDSSDNAVIEAVAGSGKTTTLRMICEKIAVEQPRANVAFLAFNKKIADDIGLKLKEAGLDWKRFNSGTFHSFGMRAWMGQYPLSEINAYKIDNLMEAKSTPVLFTRFVKQLVSFMKQHCYGVAGVNDEGLLLELIDHYDMTQLLIGEDEELDDQTLDERLAQAISWSKSILKESNLIGAEFIDFDDMIYLPLLYKVPFRKYSYVLVDEAQDTNTARRLMADAMLAEDGRLFAVGDRHQAIYGFAGANADAIDLIKERFHCTELQLTVSWRCARSIVEHAQRWVSHIQAADNAEPGSVSEMEDVDFQKLAPEPGDAILCRNTKPLIGLVLSYLRRDIPATIEGRDVGQSLIALTTKWKKPRTIGQLLRVLEKYFEKESKRLRSQRHEGQVALLEDKIESIKAIAGGMGEDERIEVLRAKINALFSDSDGTPRRTVILSTIHKAKGREWNKVYLYGRNKFMPSYFAKQEWELQQENNLIYVAVTRAKRELIEVNV